MTLAAANATDLATVVSTLVPTVRRHAAAAEDGRAMPVEIMEALVSSGVLRMWVPRAYGGLEASPNESLDVMEQLARVDAATGWVVSNCVFISTLAQFLPADVRAGLLGDVAAVTCGSFVPPGTARRRPGGHLIDGDWSFGSAVHHATSIATLVMVVDEDGTPVLGEAGPTSLVAFFGRDEVELRDTWHTLGLRGTGSTNFVARALFVPDSHAFALGPWQQDDGPFSGPLYRLGLIMDAVRIAKVGVGIAQGAVDDLVDLAAGKTPAYTATLTADRATVQERVGRAQALVQAGRSSLQVAVEEGLRTIADGSRLSGERCVPLGLASAFALDAAVQAVDLCYESAGSTAFRDASPLQRRFRDIQTLRQNAITSWSRYESLGKMLLGRSSDWPFHLL